MRYIILDIATVPIDGAAAYLEPPTPPANYKDPDKIAAYLAEKTAEAASRAALDPDLGRISGIGIWSLSGHAEVRFCRTEAEECAALTEVADLLNPRDRPVLIGYNSQAFDWPYLNRRARYLGIAGIDINCDRYKSPHVDLLAKLTNHGQWKAHTLGFYARRLGWDVAKPLSGAEESRVMETGRWDELRASILHDVEVTWRLATWMGVM